MSPFGTMSDAALSIAANSVSANIYAGKLFEFVSACVVRIRASASAAGLLFRMLANGVTVVDDQAVAGDNVWPKLPDHLVIQYPFGGGRLLAFFRNTTGGALTVNEVTEILG